MPVTRDKQRDRLQWDMTTIFVMILVILFVVMMALLVWPRHHPGEMH